MQQIRAATLIDFVDVAKSVGLDPYQLLREVGIAPAVFDAPETRLPVEAARRLLERSAALSGNANFGLLLAQRRSFASFGPVALLLERLTSLRDVVLTCIEHPRLFSDVLSVRLTEHEDSAVIEFGVTPEHASPTAVDLTLGLGYRLLSGATAGAWKPESVHVVHTAPRDVSIWRRHFAAPIVFDSTFNGFTCSLEALEVAGPLADEAMAEHARTLLRHAIPPPLDEPFTERISRNIQASLASGGATLERTARSLGISRRDLQRKLQQEGTSFGDLLRQVRRDVARSYLADSRQPITAIAELSGFAAPASFTRWFTREFGTSPLAWRAKRSGQGLQGPPPLWKV